MHELVPNARMTGRIHLYGEDLYGPKVDPTLVRRRVGMVFQKSNPFPTMSIADNVTVGLRLNGIRDSIFAASDEKALRLSALWDEVKNELDHTAFSLLRRASGRNYLYRTCDCSSARSSINGRAGIGIGSHRNCARRRTHSRVEEEIHNHHAIHFITCNKPPELQIRLCSSIWAG